MKPVLGIFTDTAAAARVDLPRLLETKLLLQAGSGFGKSWALRRILEQTHEGCQQFVIDPEGEFATLRERHGYVLAAVNGGDVVAHPRTAGLLARRLVEMKVSAVLDISELKKPERRRFVRLFLEELMGLPRAMWTPLLVAIDEAHEFAPEKDESESLSAVIDLATRGRKRGFSLLAATQRIGKFSKDAAAELHNKLIGFTSLDIDVKRAAFELGMTPTEALKELRSLEPGDFFAIGPAITPTIRRMRIGDVATTHPRPGTRKLQAPPKPTAEIIAVLPKLADLPKEAEQEQKTLEDLRRELAQARRELQTAQRAAPRPGTTSPGAAKEVLAAAEQRGYARGAADARKELTRAYQALRTRLLGAIDAMAQSQKAGLQRQVAELFEEVKVAAPENPVRRVISSPAGEVSPALPSARAARARQIDGAATPSSAETSPGTLRLQSRKILAALAQHGACSANKLALLCGYHYGGGFRTSLAELRTASLITGANDSLMEITDEGMALGPFDLLPTGDALREYWLSNTKLRAQSRKILEVLLRHVQGMSGPELAEETRYEYGGGFRTSLAELRTAGLIVGKNDEVMHAVDSLLQ